MFYGQEAVKQPADSKQAVLRPVADFRFKVADFNDYSRSKYILLLLESLKSATLNQKSATGNKTACFLLITAEIAQNL